MSNRMNVAALRKRKKMSQQEFWSHVGMTQSAGSRYENGRAIPKPIMMLLKLAYGTERQYRSVYDALMLTR